MLNQEQKQAVEFGEGALRIVAGAGTGKTFTIIERISYLISEKRIKPGRILVLTFTNKAAHELQERLSKKGHPGVNAMTFHSFAANILRKYWSVDFQIIDSSRKNDILKGILQKSEVKDLKDITIDVDNLRVGRILEKGASKIISSLNEAGISEILDKYEEILAEENAMDFGGLLVGVYKLWLVDDEILSFCKESFDYVLVDEYQDVNELQIEILRKLVEGHGNICVVGDSDQTIYSWRGADAGTLGKFEEVFGSATTVILAANYRNPKQILKAAEKLISNNSGRIEKELKSTLERNSQVSLWEAKDENEEVEVVMHLLERYLGSMSSMHDADDFDNNSDFRQMSDIAFLYRTQSQGRRIAVQMSRKGYPYQISSNEYFWHKKNVKEFLEELNELKELENFPEKKFSEWMSELLENFLESKKLLDQKADALKHLIPYAIQFDELQLPDALLTFFDEVKLEQEADNLLYADRVNLLTLHAAKGLEFPIVIILGLNEDEIPFKKLKDDEYWLSEERRLLYVGMTRAKANLHLICVHKKEDKQCERSRFLGEIGLDNMVLETLPERKVQKLKKKAIRKAQMSLF